MQVVAACICCVLAMVCVPHLAWPQEGDETPGKPISFENLHAAYLADTELQLERPVREVTPPPEPRRPTPSWLLAIAEFFAAILQAIGPLLKFLLVVIVLGGVGALLWFLFGEALTAQFRSERKPKDDVLESEEDAIRPDAATARTLLEEADALAREGRYAEAVHLLLFRSIEDIQTRLSTGVPRSLTAREIGGLTDLPQRARSALSPIIHVVERSFFGGRDVDADGWNAARASYEDFAFGGPANG